MFGPENFKENPTNQLGQLGLLFRTSLRALYVLVDARHGFKWTDHEWLTELGSAGPMKQAASVDPPGVKTLVFSLKYSILMLSVFHLHGTVYCVDVGICEYDGTFCCLYMFTSMNSYACHLVVVVTSLQGESNVMENDQPQVKSRSSCMTRSFWRSVTWCHAAWPEISPVAATYDGA